MIALELFLNFLVAGICFILGIVFSIGWYITHREKSELITKIENQPRFVAQLTRTEGSTESGTVAPSNISDI